MIDMLTRKLECFSPLGMADKVLIAGLVAHPSIIDPHVDLMCEGQKGSNTYVVMAGFAQRYKSLPNGSRQILSLMLPGDFSEIDTDVVDATDYSIGTTTECRIVTVKRDDIASLLEHPAIARALRWASLVDDSIARQSLVNIGRRTAELRLSHFLCELLVRLEMVGLVRDGTFDLPFTQADLADTLGISTVHVNRVLQRLRGKDLIATRNRSVKVLDVEGLKTFCAFNPNYLHLGARSGQWRPTLPMNGVTR